MPDGSCCLSRNVSDNGRSCTTPQQPCAKGEFRDSSGACVPVAPSPTCASGEVADNNGRCVRRGSGTPPPPVVRGRPHPVAPHPPPARPGPPPVRGGGAFRR
jgi:hypothetical protein